MDEKLQQLDTLLLCGGLGTRLAEVVSDRPKPMADVNGKPFLDMLIAWFSGFGVRRYILCTGHMANVIKKYYAWRSGPVDLAFSEEDSPLGTAGAVKNAQPHIQTENFIVANGDSFCAANLNRLWNTHVANNAIATVLLVSPDKRDDAGSVVVDSKNRVTAFAEKICSASDAHVNAGVYIFNRKILDIIEPDRKSSLEYDIFPELIGKGFYGHVSDGQLLDIGTPQRYARAAEFMSNALAVQNEMEA
jgi:NDP-sugar pyrophosphorylase family protein